MYAHRKLCRVSNASTSQRPEQLTSDLLNRLIRKTPEASLGEQAVVFTYTATGQRASMTDASGSTTYSYDNRDRLLNKATPPGTLSYTHDTVGNVLSIRSSNVNGASMSYSYGALNRLVTAVGASGTTQYTCNQAGYQASALYANGLLSTFSYDALDRMTNVAASKGGTLATFACTLGAAGHRLSMTELSGRRASYSYDSVFKLTGETITGDPATNGSIGYTHDPVGNRLSLTSSVSQIPAAIYSYDANDRLAADTYDANGNTIASGGNTLSYDFENRLSAAEPVALHRSRSDPDGHTQSRQAAGAIHLLGIRERAASQMSPGKF